MDIVPLLLDRIESSQKCSKDPEKIWEIRDAKGDEGRGLYAARDLNPGDLIFADEPLLFGPKGGGSCDPMCSNCYKKQQCFATARLLSACRRGCGLPVCGRACEESASHRRDCDRITAWQRLTTTSWSLNIMRALTPIRALSLNEFDRRIVELLKTHHRSDEETGSHHINRQRDEIDLLKSALLDDNGRDTMSCEDERYMRRVCAALDTNTFEVPVVNYDENGEEQMSLLRGLYPLFAMMNHSCTPNVRHSFHHSGDQRDKKSLTMTPSDVGGGGCDPGIIAVTARASRHVRRGEQLTICYTDPTASTGERRRHLHQAKSFWCRCERCRDPTEFCTNLSAIYCTNKNCSGLMLPWEPLSPDSKWRCNSCQNHITHKIAHQVNSKLRRLNKELKSIRSGDGLGDIMKFLETDENDTVPQCNYCVWDLKKFAVTNMGYSEHYKWEDLTQHQLKFKETLCREILSFLIRIKSGASVLRAQVLYELQKCLKERMASTARTDDQCTGRVLQDVVLEEARGYFEEAAEILRNDVTAPRDIKRFNSEQ